VIHRLGRQGVTWKSWRVWGRNSFRNREILSVKKSVYPLEIVSVSGILFEYHVESWKAKIAN
jgi:hypothetical protein